MSRSDLVSWCHTTLFFWNGRPRVFRVCFWKHWENVFNPDGIHHHPRDCLLADALAPDSVDGFCAKTYGCHHQHSHCGKIILPPDQNPEHALHLRRLFWSLARKAPVIYGLLYWTCPSQEQVNHLLGIPLSLAILATFDTTMVYKSSSTTFCCR